MLGALKVADGLKEEEFGVEKEATGGGSVHLCKHTLRELVSLDSFGVNWKVGLHSLEKVCQERG